MNPRADLSAIMTAALEAVDPAEAVKHHLRRESHQLWIGQESWDLQDNNRLLLLAAGKAAVPMAEAAAEIVGEYLTAGIVVTKYHHATGHHLPSVLEVMESAHPVPDAAGVRGAQAMVDLLADTTAQDHVLVLLSGGASSKLKNIALEFILGPEFPKRSGKVKHHLFMLRLKPEIAHYFRTFREILNRFYIRKYLGGH